MGMHGCFHSWVLHTRFVGWGLWLPVKEDSLLGHGLNKGSSPILNYVQKKKMRKDILMFGEVFRYDFLWFHSLQMVGILKHFPYNLSSVY